MAPQNNTPKIDQSDASIVVTDHGRVRVVEINRPECRNAVDGPTARALYEAFRAFDVDDTVDVAVLAGRGGAFCAGADLKALSQEGDANPMNAGGRNTLAPMGISRMQLSKPVIAAVEGHAVAGGMELALWCDLRVVAEDAVFGIFCRRFGVPLIDLGTIRLPRLIGQSRAMDLILTGRPVEADEALVMGLANRVVPNGQSLAAAIELAEKISGFPQQCMRNDRQSVLQQWGLDWDEAIAREFSLGMETVQSGETLSGADAFRDGKGRHGDFGDRNGDG